MQENSHLVSLGTTATAPTPLFEGPVSPTSAAVARLHPLGLSEVVLTGGGALGDWQRRNGAQTLPHCVEQARASGAISNLENVWKDGPRRPHAGMHFSDSDVYKVLEAAAWESVRGLSGGVKEFAEQVPGLLSSVQRPDGYLNSWFQGQHPELVWKDLRWGHELYCAGHLLQAAVASRRTGANPALFSVASKLVAHLLETFSLEDGDGRLVGVCGHPEIETALVEFYRLTGGSQALELAKRQVDLRGRADVELPSGGPLGDRRFPLSYFLHHLPVRQQTLATGHAVRELYLQAGVVDVAVETGDEELLGASETIWEDLFATKTYVTGAHGSRHRDESIGDAYELPSDRAYAETCAAIASFQWNWRLLLATGRPRYAEAMEIVFWNTIAGAVSRPGTEFFYSNSLQLRTDHAGIDEDSPRHRLSWYECACCPPNLARLMASIQAYLVTRDADGLQVQMPFRGSVSTGIPGGAVTFTVDASHPWEGTTEIEIARSTSTEGWALSVRCPEWASKQSATLTVNGRPAEVSWDGTYARVTRRWSPGDRLQIHNSMPVRVLSPHWRVDAVRNCVAVQRGPLVYCLEADDLDEGTVLEDVFLDLARPLQPTHDVPAGLQGYVEVTVAGSGRRAEGPGQLYDEAENSQLDGESLPLTFVPYFSRSNRESGTMRVWLPAARPDNVAEHLG
jgi:DUF1680 family protein